MNIKWVSATCEITNVVLGIGAEIVLGGKPRRNVVLFKILPPTGEDMRQAKDALEGWAERVEKRWNVLKD